MKLRLASPRYLVDLGTVPGLRGVRVDGDALAIGALTVHADVASSDLVRKHLPGLADAASVIGDVQVRNRGTIGGSVAHADPAADFPVILVALNASFALHSPSGKRTVAADDFFVDFYTTALAPNEILTEIRVPLPPSNAGTAYAKLGHPAAAYDLGLLYLEGQLFPQDFARAAEMFRAAAEIGNREAQYALATLYKEGRGVPKDVVEAARLGPKRLAGGADRLCYARARRRRLALARRGSRG